MVVQENWSDYISHCIATSYERKNIYVETGLLKFDKQIRNKFTIQCNCKNYHAYFTEKILLRGGMAKIKFHAE